MSDVHSLGSPDPSRLTTDAVDKAKEEILALVHAEEQRIEDLMMRAFDQVSEQFVQVENQRIETKADAKVSIDAAFLAQAASAKQQDDANQKAIDKSEKTVTDSIAKLQDLFKTTTDGLQTQVNDVKILVSGMVHIRQGGKEANAATYGLIAAIVAVLLIITYIAGGNRP